VYRPEALRLASSYFCLHLAVYRNGYLSRRAGNRPGPTFGALRELLITSRLLQITRYDGRSNPCSSCVLHMREPQSFCSSSLDRAREVFLRRARGNSVAPAIPSSIWCTMYKMNHDFAATIISLRESLRTTNSSRNPRIILQVQYKITPLITA